MTEDIRAVGDRRKPHSVVECAQADLLKSQSDTLARLDGSYARVAVALEELARRGAQVDGHEKRLDKNDVEHEEVFKRLRAMERLAAVEDGIDKVEGERTKFWTEVKLRLIGPLMTGTFFALWLSEKFGVLDWITKQFCEMGGKR